MSNKSCSNRKFGLQLSAGLLVPSVLVSISSHSLWLWTVPFSIVFLTISVFAPEKLEYLKRGIEALGKIISVVLAFISFYGIITPFSWILRLSKAYQLPLKPDKSQKTYWEKPDESQTSNIDFRKQF